MTEATEVTIKGALCAIALAVVLWRHLRPGILDPRRAGGAVPEARRAGGALAITAFVAVLAWTNFGIFHNGRFAHRWEQFHYFLGAKYFAELGYDGLYVASVGAQMQSVGGTAQVQPFLRDLRTNVMRPTDTLGDHGFEVRRRFSDARWAEFQRDNAHFLNAGNYDYVRQIRLDHGYNPSPLWTAVARVFAAVPAASGTTLGWLASLDILLLVALFVALHRTYGGRAAGLALTVFGLGYAWRWDWIGGGFLRLDWLAALGLAICALATRRAATAGALIAYAGLVRVFPFAFLLGPAVVALRAWRSGEDLRWARRFGAGFLLALTLGLGAGALAGRGPGAWTEFAHNVAKHQRTWLTNNVGAKLVLLYGPDTFGRRLVDGSLPDAFAPWEAAMAQAQSARRPAIALLAAVLLLLIANAAWRSTPDEALVLGCAAVFAATAPTCYYWAMLALVPIRGPFRRSGWSATALIALSGLLFALHRTTSIFERIYGLMSWLLLLLTIAWLLPDLLATLRREPIARETRRREPLAAQKAEARSKRR